MIFLGIEIQGDKIVEQQLLRGSEALARMKTPLWEVREDIFRIIKINFESQGRRGGGSWKSLDPATAAAKERKGLDPRILYARHKLIDSLTVRGNRNMRSNVTNSEVFLRSTLPYVATQQYGDEERGIPARPFIQFLPNDRTRWIELCKTFVMEAMAGV